jgi:glutathione S-transferase
VNLKEGEQSSEQYKEQNPNEKVPSLADGDLKLGESGAIVRYLASSVGETTVYPSDPRQRALVDSHLSSLNDLRRTHLLLTYVKVQPTFYPTKPVIPEAIVNNQEASLETIFQEYSKIVGDNEYIVLNQLTLADFALALELITFEIYKYDYQTKFPNLDRYLKNLLLLANNNKNNEFRDLEFKREVIILTQ